MQFCPVKKLTSLLVVKMLVISFSSKETGRPKFLYRQDLSFPQRRSGFYPVGTWNSFVLAKHRSV